MTRKLSKRKALASAFAGVVLAIGGAAFAAPDFGPGNSSKGPQDPAAKCHPPGQTAGDPGCKD